MMMDCDFIPMTYHEQRSVKGAMRHRTACVLAMIGVMIVWIVAHHYQLKSASAILKTVEEQKSELGLVATKRAELELERERLSEHQGLIDQLSDQADLMIVLSDLSRCMPENVMLTEMSLNATFMTQYLVNPGEATLIAPGGTEQAEKVIPAPPTPIETLKITGVAVAPTDVFEFATQVEKSGLFDHVYAEVLDAKDWGGRRPHRFELTCDILPHEGSTR